MSNIYIQEPPTNGKVLLKTTLGDIDIELWSKEAPKACRNFVQLCMEGYYDGTIFHRIVKGFIAQGGDPTGTGTGGDSIYGKPFKDEFHQRLKFNRRGLVAMANAGKDDNGSQFFFTLDRAEELQKKHTIFGKVTGNTIYNMIKFNDLDIDHDERPVSPPKITRTEILSNPFDDIEPRHKKKSKEKNEKSGQKIKSHSKATKNYKLLSFGEEAEENEEEEHQFKQELKIKSSHDALDDPKLSSQPALDSNDLKRKEEDMETDVIRKKLKREDEQGKKRNDSDDEEEVEKRKKAERRRALREEEKLLKRELKSKKNPPKEVQIEKEKKEKKPANELIQELRAERDVFKQKKKEDKLLKKGSDRENQTLSLLAGFESKLGSILGDEDEESQQNDKEEREENSGDNWMKHRLNFEESEESGAKDANMKGDDWYDIYDPRNPLNKRRRDKKNNEVGGTSKGSSRS